MADSKITLGDDSRGRRVEGGSARGGKGKIERKGPRQQ